MKAIGLIGFIGSGKDSAAEHISKKHGYTLFSMGTAGVSGELTKKDGLEVTRENLQKTTEKYRKKYGMDYLAKLTLQKILSSGTKKALIKDLRKPEDITTPKQYFKQDMIVILIDANPRVRFERLRARASARDPRTFEEFQENEKSEHELFFSKSMGMHDYIIKNNGTREELYKKIDDLLAKIGFD